GGSIDQAANLQVAGPNRRSVGCRQGPLCSVRGGGVKHYVLEPDVLCGYDAPCPLQCKLTFIQEFCRIDVCIGAHCLRVDGDYVHAFHQL
ncbi:MAG: hypothetical protein WBH18_12970, partial [Lentibacter algarum]|uniref:hypothetical protein n=1 Tax=Lentibacter algarum TaxID=576131 RepID=UPI003C71DEEA